MYRNTFVEINIDNLQENVKNIKNYFNNYKYYFGVVKGNAYGHDIHIINYLIESRNKLFSSFIIRRSYKT